MNDRIWPISITIFFGIAIVVFVSFAVWTGSHSVDLVADDYYAQEIAHQGRIDAESRAMTLPEKPQGEYDADKNEYRLTFPANLVAKTESGTLTFYRPSDKDLDLEVPLALSDTPQVFPTPDMKPGLWNVRLEWTMEDETYYQEEAIVVQ